jgi:hypothetical protein
MPNYTLQEIQDDLQKLSDKYKLDSFYVDDWIKVICFHSVVNYLDGIHEKQDLINILYLIDGQDVVEEVHLAKLVAKIKVLCRENSSGGVRLERCVISQKSFTEFTKGIPQDEDTEILVTNIKVEQDDGFIKAIADQLNLNSDGVVLGIGHPKFYPMDASSLLLIGHYGLGSNGLSNRQEKRKAVH